MRSHNLRQVDDNDCAERFSCLSLASKGEMGRSWGMDERVMLKIDTDKRVGKVKYYL